MEFKVIGISNVVSYSNNKKEKKSTSRAQWKIDFQARSVISYTEGLNVLFTIDLLIFRQINMSLLIHLYKHQPSVPLENSFFLWFGILGYLLLVKGRSVVSLQDFLCSLYLHFSYFHEKKIQFFLSIRVGWITGLGIKTCTPYHWMCY